MSKKTAGNTGASTRLVRASQRHHPLSQRKNYAARVLATAFAVGVAGGVFSPIAQAQSRPFSSGWMAAKGAAQAQAAATGRLPNGMLAGINPAAQQQAQARQQLNRSVANLGSAAAAIAAQQAVQAAARAAPQNDPSVPDGLTEGGLKIDAQPLTAGWLNAKAPAQTQAGGRTTVTIQQTADKAILNWETFNVGRNTTVNFDQATYDAGGNRTAQTGWAVLNRVNDPNARPSQIQGRIEADGTVMLVNRNGIVFSGSSQVNVRNLVAAAADIKDDQFSARGLYGADAGAQASFTNAQGGIDIRRGAQIATHTPASATQGGGYVLLMGRELHNAGQIATPDGQVALAAGDSFFIRKGQGTEGNQHSSTQGNEVAARLNTDSLTTGRVVNAGLIMATTGDITLTGREVVQQAADAAGPAGVALTTTTVNKRGTIHLLNSRSDGDASVTLGAGSVTAILVDEGAQTALDAQRDALANNLDVYEPNKTITDALIKADGVFDNLAIPGVFNTADPVPAGGITDRRDQSRIEIVSGGTIAFEGDSLTLATGGQIAVQAEKGGSTRPNAVTGRTWVGRDAVLDVAGAVGVKVAMENNNILVNVQGNELRDAPVNRDSNPEGNNSQLSSKDVWVDVRDLVFIKGDYDALTNPQGTPDRWYTQGGLLEVSGWRGLQAHGAGEWLAQGGTVTFAGQEVITQAGSIINLSGGTLDVQDGYIEQSWVRGADGRLYEVSRAPGDILYKGIYEGYQDEHARWGEQATRSFYNPLIAPRRRYESGYTVGRDAGQLVVSTRNAILEGDIVGEVYQGDRQTRAPEQGLDGYDQRQTAAARRGQLLVGGYTPIYDAQAKRLAHNLSDLIGKIVFTDAPDALGDALAAGDALPDERDGVLVLDAGRLSRQNLGAIKVAATNGIDVQGSLSVADGGEIALYGAAVDVQADLTAHSGRIALGNVLPVYSTAWGERLIVPNDAAVAAHVAVADGVRLDATGRQGSQRKDMADALLLPYVDGGEVSIRSSGEVSIGEGSLIDVSSGAVLLANNKLQGGRGGDVTLASGALSNVAAPLYLNGEIRGYGVLGGGTLRIESGTAVGIGAQLLSENGVLKAGETAPIGLTLREEVEVGLGETLLADYSYLSDIWQPGDRYPAVPSWNGRITLYLPISGIDITLITEEDWQIPYLQGPNRNIRNSIVVWVVKEDGTQAGYAYPSNWYLDSVTPEQIAAASIVPKGSRIAKIENLQYLPIGWRLPEDVFPNGIPVASTYEAMLPAGTLLTEKSLAQVGASSITIPVGALVPTGTQLSRDAKVAPILQLNAEDFQRGFSHYDVRGAQGVVVSQSAQDESIDVMMPILRQQGVAANGDPILELWKDIPLYTVDPVAQSITQRRGASLSLTAGNAGQTTSGGREGIGVHIAENGAITVDPLQSIALNSIGGITVEGRLTAKGGTIELRELTASLANPADADPAKRLSMLIGERAVLDASGGAVVARNGLDEAFGYSYAGGQIILGGVIDEEQGKASAAHLFIDIRQGALLDASGGAAFDQNGQLRHASAGGVISLATHNGWALDGRMVAASGGGNAAGGTLSLALESPVYDTRRGNGGAYLMDVLTQREITLYQRDADLRAAGDVAFGQGYLSVEQIAAGGFANLALLSNGMISFADGVALDLGERGQSIRLYSIGIGWSDGAQGQGESVIRAPYVRLAGANFRELGDVYQARANPDSVGGMSQDARGASGALSVSADLIDLRDQLRIGLHSDGSGFMGPALDRRGFTDVVLDSAGDIRFLGSNSGLLEGTLTMDLYVPQRLELLASRVYPATGVRARIVAGNAWGTKIRPGGGDTMYDPQSLIRVARSSRADPALSALAPYSLYGQLSFGAAEVRQDGVVLAPLGLINLGTADSSGLTERVMLGADSVTSVSAAGLVMPYGGTVDGIDWQTPAGSAYTPQGLGATDSTNLTSGVALTGSTITVGADARIDLSGGGDVLGFGFVSGRGGSTDVRYSPLLQLDGDGVVRAPSRSSNAVYALVPDYAGYAPAGNGSAALDPMVGQTIRFENGSGLPDGIVPGVAYTLMPADYALLPGAFRVELNGRLALGFTSLGAQSAMPVAQAAAPMRNGSWSAAGRLGVANSGGMVDSDAYQVILTPAQTMKRYAQYNETSYADFVLADAARKGIVRGLSPDDARSLLLRFNPRYRWDGTQWIAEEDGRVVFEFDGSVNFKPAKDGDDGSVVLTGATAFVGDTAQLEVLSDAAAATRDFGGISVRASDLNAMGAGRIAIGGAPYQRYGTNDVRFMDSGSTSRGLLNVTLREGAVLRAPEVMLVTRSEGSITVESGAGINTIGMGLPAFGAGNELVYTPADRSVLAVSNGWANLLAPSASAGGGRIEIGACPAGAADCSSAALALNSAQLYSEGTIALATHSDLRIDESARYGTRNLLLAVAGINVGGVPALDAARERGVLTDGLTLNQQVLDRLLRGDQAYGAPALENLFLTAGRSMNFFESVALNTLDPATGRSRLNNLVLTTPAIYGYGGAQDVALIQTGTLVWNGSAGKAPAAIAQGAGSGSGALRVEAERIEFGYGPWTQPDGVTEVGRLALGFAGVQLSATDRVTANHEGSLSVYQTQGVYVPGKGYDYQGGSLLISTPLLTGEAGSVNRIAAGGAIDIRSPLAEGQAQPVSDALGATLTLEGRGGIVLDSAVMLPSGRLTVSAHDDVILGERALLDVSGRSIDTFDLTQYSWGGEVILESQAGNIRQAGGSVIDLSAEYNQAGRLTVAATDAGAGVVDLQGRILGGASGYYDAGGTYVPYLAGFVDIHSTNLGGSGDLSGYFASLNRRLNDGGVFGGRSFQIKQGSLTIGNDPDSEGGAGALLKANQVNVSIDGGSLTVAGIIDAGGERVGSIRLAARDGLTIGGNALLDAHGRLLRLDSYGKIIDAPNRAIVELNSGQGLLTLAEGARIDLRHGTDDARVQADPALHDGQARGTLELYAPRLGADPAVGDVAIDASRPVTIEGAKSIAVIGAWRYDDADPDALLRDGSQAASGRPYREITQDYLDKKDTQSQAFINNALGNSSLINGKLAGLNNDSYRDVLHLRPGVEIVTDRDMVVNGDLDLSGHRYDSLNPLVKARYTPTAQAGDAGYGSGEPGSLVLRTGGDLDVYGSINDGFALPIDPDTGEVVATPDDNGWVLTPGKQAFDIDVVTPRYGIVLKAGTTLPAGSTLNYDLPATDGVNLPAGAQLPAAATLAANTTFGAGTVLPDAVTGRAADGRDVTVPAGKPFPEALTLNSGTALGAGAVLPVAAKVNGLAWPKGVPLATAITLGEDKTLAMGAFIPANASLVLDLPEGELSIPLRAAGGGNQGKNWAVAPMLEAGSLSWSMRLVAGADTDAADSRLLKPRDQAGNLTLADTHYVMYSKAGGALVWTAVGASDFGLSPSAVGKPVADYLDEIGEPSVEAACGYDPGYCAMGGGPLVWTEFGASDFGLDPSAVGKPVADYLGAIGEPNAEAACSYDPGYCVAGPGRNESTPSSLHFSVVRTGTGDLELLASGDVWMQSAYGVYTAGSDTVGQGGFSSQDFYQPRGRSSDLAGSILGSQGKTDGADYERLVDEKSDTNLYRAWYPDQGGNVVIAAGRDLLGSVWAAQVGDGPAPALLPSAGVGNWSWRQGTGAGSSADDVPTAWWVNFGTYAHEPFMQPEFSDAKRQPHLVGFTGIGALGGGNVMVDVGRHAGVVSDLGVNTEHSDALVVAIGGTGKVLADGQMALTGGGDLVMRIGGGINRVQADPAQAWQAPRHELQGAIINLRGSMDIQAAYIGRIAQEYNSQFKDRSDSRAADPFTPTAANATAGIVLAPGDATVRIAVAGDMVLGAVTDPGRSPQVSTTPYQVDGQPYEGGGLTGFSLWTDNTAVSMHSVGGDAVLSTQLGELEYQQNNPVLYRDTSPTDGSFALPSRFAMSATAGNLYMGHSGIARATKFNDSYPLMLAPSATGTGYLDLIAGKSIYAGGYTIDRSGADPSVLATPFQPRFSAWDRFEIPLATKNYPSVYAIGMDLARTNSLDAFGDIGNALWDAPPLTAAHFYAREGDIVGLRTGELLEFTRGDLAGSVLHAAAGPLKMQAGRDIVGSGDPLGSLRYLAQDSLNANNIVSIGNLIVHNDANDVSVVSAGGNILFSSFSIAGPGTLEISAGGDIRLDDQNYVTSLGPVSAADKRPGASIVMQAGMGAGVNYAGFLDQYLNPGNLLVTGVALADQPGKVAKSYEEELAAWLAERYGFEGTVEEALAVFAALAPEQQRIFARQVYFAELREGGREYNDADGPRFGSYLRGRNAIAALFPSNSASGEPNVYQGDITMYGGAGIHTRMGGDIQMLTPGGRQLFGIEGAAPPSTAGVITQGFGNIQLYSLGSILLGQSRIMTTFGGDVLAWAAQGDINAGRGSKTTVVYTPPRRVYDQWGNVGLSSDVPTTGAGIATLAPIADVPPGNMDLIAPEGTIDAGEAGIRVSGNVNIAALHVVNAANIQVKGDSVGIPMAAVVNTGALASASSASASAAAAAQETVSRARNEARQNQPSIFSVQILGFGNEEAV